MTKTTKKSTPKSRAEQEGVAHALDVLDIPRRRAAFLAKLRALCAEYNVHLSGDLDGNVVAYFMEGKYCDAKTPYRVVA